MKKTRVSGPNPSSPISFTLSVGRRHTCTGKVRQVIEVIDKQKYDSSRGDIFRNILGAKKDKNGGKGKR